MTDHVNPRHAIGNPVRASEVRAQLRGSTGPALLTGWGLIVGGVAIAVLLALAGTDQPLRGARVDATQLGRTLGEWWVVTTTVGLALLGAAVGAPTIAGRREVQTLRSWCTTLQRPRDVALGAYSAAAVTVTLGLAVAAPVAVLAWRLGGASGRLLIAGGIGAWAVGLAAAALGVAVSSFSRRTGRATLVACGIVALSLLATGAAHLALFDKKGRGDAVLYANPLVLVATSTSGSPAADGGAERWTRTPVTHLDQLARGTSATSRTARAPVDARLIGAGGVLSAALVALAIATGRVGREGRR